MRAATSLVVRVVDAELSRVLVLAGTLDDQQDAVVGDVGHELGAGSPGVAAIVRDRFGDGADGLDISAGPAEEYQRDGAFRAGRPLNGVGLPDRNLVAQPGFENGIARGRFGVVRLSVSRGHGRKGGDDGCEGEMHDFSDIG